MQMLAFSNICLHFMGNVQEAFNFYKSILKTKSPWFITKGFLFACGEWGNCTQA